MLPAQSAARYHLTGYVGAELPEVLALTDVVLFRSGARTIAELTAFGKAAGFVPLATSTGDEQVDRAEHLATDDAAVTPVGEATAERLWASVATLLTDPQQRTAMAERARAYGRPDASGHLVDVALSAAGPRPFPLNHPAEQMKMAAR
ncbi:glycosyltransferase [Streptomyces sp. NPDC056333]|uniref:glycosyltransferase n=1 Tax=Streptomyces sp. NPDC056333 TaxID=3345786 RepID=UPI0035DA537B